MARAKKRPKKTETPKRENLIYLIYAPNTCYTQLVEKRPRGIRLDLNRGMWQMSKRDSSGCVQKYNQQIGRARPILRDAHSGPIGVYDRTKFEHLAQMSRDGGEAIRDERGYSGE